MSDKKNKQIKQQILHNFVEILELFPQYTTSQHLVHVLRPRDKCYNWSEDEFLKKLEEYRDELENDSIDIDYI